MGLVETVRPVKVVQSGSNGWSCEHGSIVPGRFQAVSMVQSGRGSGRDSR